MAKTYTVVKDGIELKELKTLPAAKKLADAEGAEVVCEGEMLLTIMASFAQEESRSISENVKWGIRKRFE